MPSPTLSPPASLAPLLAASIAPGPPPVMTAKPACASARPSSSAWAYAGCVGRGPRRAEHPDRRSELGQRTEALDELGLDPEHPPRVGVHPVRRAARVQQPLVGGGPVDLVAAHQLGAASLRAGGSCRRGLITRPGPARRAGAARTPRSGRSARARPAGGRAIGSPGPKLTAGTPSAEKRATSVQPNFGLTRPPTASTNARAAGTSRPGRAPGAVSVTRRRTRRRSRARRPRPPPRSGRGRSGS